MPENTDSEQPKKTRMERIAGPAVFVGCFVIWPATNVYCTILNYKGIDKQLKIEELKQAATQLS